jgi:hypothetical protein
MVLKDIQNTNCVGITMNILILNLVGHIITTCFKGIIKNCTCNRSYILLSFLGLAAEVLFLITNVTAALALR